MLIFSSEQTPPYEAGGSAKYFKAQKLPNYLALTNKPIFTGIFHKGTPVNDRFKCTFPKWLSTTTPPPSPLEHFVHSKATVFADIKCILKAFFIMGTDILTITMDKLFLLYSCNVYDSYFFVATHTCV